MSVKTAKAPRVADDYLELTRRFPLVPIRNEKHFKLAISVLDELSIIDEEKLTRGQGDYLFVLTDLVERYEEEHHPMARGFAGPVEAVKYLLEQNGMTASDLGRLLGNRPLGGAILRGERQLSKGNIVRLAERFGVSTDLFLRMG